MQTAKEVKPISLRKPGSHFTHLGGGVLGCGNGRNHQFATEPELVGYLVSILALRMAVIHRLYQRQQFLMGLVIHRIQVREEGMAQTQPLLHNALGRL